MKEKKIKNKNLKKEDNNFGTHQYSRGYYEPVYTIGIAAVKTNITVHTLRLYEIEGLIIPYKTETGRRLYSDLELEKVRCIREMIKEKGLNFEGIRRIISLVPCWKLRDCGSDKGKNCPAFSNRSKPCWAIDKKCASPLSSCRDCPVYQKIANCEDVQKLIQS